MKRLSAYQQNFAKGEIDPQLWGNADLEGYYEGVAEGRNVWVTATGAAEKRYGMQDVHTFSDADTVRLFGFVNTRGTRFLLAVSDAGTIDIFRSVTGEHLQTLALAGLTTDRVQKLCAAAYGDSVILTAEGLEPQILKWNGDDPPTFNLMPIVFEAIPSYEFSPDDLEPAGTLTPSATVGYITCTSSVAVFQASDVGKYIDVLPLGRLKITKVNGNKSVSGFLEEELESTAAISAGNWILERGWSPLWGDGNYPAVCAFHEGRLLLANFPRARTAIAFSIVDAPFNFNTGDGSVGYGGVRTVSQDQANAVYHILSHNSLFIFCANAEFIINQDVTTDLHRAPISLDSSRGCVQTIRPMEGEDGGTYFFHQNSVGISEFRYYYERNSYEAHSFTKYCGHLIKRPKSASLWKGDEVFETNILFFVNSDGTLIAATLKLVEKIMAFMEVVSDGPFDAVCAVERDIYCTLLTAEGVVLRKFAGGIYTDNGNNFLSLIRTLPINSAGSPYFFDNITTTALSVYLGNACYLEIDGNRVYAGAPHTGRIRYYGTTGWYGAGTVCLSDGAQNHVWRINGIGRMALAGGIDQ
jgi:hypothetical protein